LLPLRLVFPGEAVPAPYIREASAAACFGQRLLEAVELAFGVGLDRSFQTEEVAEVVEVRMGDGFLVQLDPFPMLDEGSNGCGVGHSSSWGSRRQRAEPCG